ncbi:MAG: hypothetical protein M3R72_07720 [Bacteroidota bacterium]|nr:hypothetical protein [Bacteroidota bacterium]
MKKVIFGLMMFLFLGATSQLFAQNGNGQQRQEAMKAYLKDSLNLSNAQIDSVTAIQAQYRPQMREIYMDQSASQTDKQTKMQALETEIEGRYKTAGLSSDVIQKMHEHQQRMMAQMRNRMNNGGGGQ